MILEDNMFVYSFRASTVKFFAVIAFAIVALVGLLLLGGGDSVAAASSTVDFSGIKTNEDRIAFIEQFGIKVGESETESVEFRIPENFDRVVAGYNEIQKRQGLDMSKYKNKKVTRYTYETANYNGSSAYVNLIVYKGSVIACDVSSTSPDGFVHPLLT